MYYMCTVYENVFMQGLVSYISFAEAIPIKCFVSHRLPSRDGGSVGRSVDRTKKRRMNT